MNKEDLSEYRDFAMALADQAGQIALAAYHRTSGSLKNDGTVVTATDLDIDRALSAAIVDRFPDQGIISEEHDTVYQGQEFAWVLDPIDGTNNFVLGIPIWGTSIALTIHGQLVLGVADFPVLNERYIAVRGQGTWRNEQQVQVRSLPRFESNEFFTCCTRTYRRYRIDTPAKARMLGSAAYDLCIVGGGAALAGSELRPLLWDIAAAWIVVEEAGGVIGNPMDDSGQPENRFFPLIPGQDYARLSLHTVAAANWELYVQFLTSMRRVRS